MKKILADKNNTLYILFKFKDLKQSYNIFYYVLFGLFDKSWTGQ